MAEAVNGFNSVVKWGVIKLSMPHLTTKYLFFTKNYQKNANFRQN